MRKDYICIFQVDDIVNVYQKIVIKGFYLEVGLDREGEGKILVVQFIVLE